MSWTSVVPDSAWMQRDSLDNAPPPPQPPAPVRRATEAPLTSATTRRRLAHSSACQRLQHVSRHQPSFACDSAFSAQRQCATAADSSKLAMHCGGVMCSVPQQPSGQCLTVVEAIEHGDEVMMAPPKHTPYAQLECGAKMGAVCGATATCGGRHGGAEAVVHLLSSRWH